MVLEQRGLRFKIQASEWWGGSSEAQRGLANRGRNNSGLWIGCAVSACQLRIRPAAAAIFLAEALITQDNLTIYPPYSAYLLSMRWQVLYKV